MDGGFDKTTETYAQNLRWLGELTGRSEQAEQAIARFDGVLAAVRERMPADAAELTFAVMDGYDTSKYAVFFDDVIFCDLLEAQGMGNCVLTPPPGTTVEDAYGEVSGEYLLEVSPDVIAHQGDGTAATSMSARTDPLWSRIPAVRDGRAYDTQAQYYCCSLRELQYTVEDYAFHAFPDAGFRDPGPAKEYDPEAAAAALGVPVG